MVYIVPRIERSLKCSDFDIVPVAKAILGRDVNTLYPHAPRRGYAVMHPWQFARQLDIVGSFVCVQIYAFMQLSVCVWAYEYVCLCM